MRIALLVGSLVILQGPNDRQAATHSYVPPNGFVPDSSTAVRIAVAVWIPIYGVRQISSEQPFIAKRQDSIWTVTGSLPHGLVGGTALAQIAQRDGRIVRVSHGR